MQIVQIAVPNPAAHTLDLQLNLEVTAPVVELRLPVWIPGSYMVREFSRYLGPLSATDEQGRSREVSRPNKNTWLIESAGAQRLTVRYTAWGHELTVRTPHIDATHAFFNGCNVIPRWIGHEHEPICLQVSAPSGWRVFCPLPMGADGYVAESYDRLADTPFELGPHECLTFEALGVSHRIVLWGDDAVRIDADHLCDDIRRIVERNAYTFDGSLPYTGYDFIIHITAEGRGGLEHLDSTVLATPWAYYETEEGREDLLGLIAHEHFHVWNVKRIKPNGIVPFDYDRENDTTGLWVSEGFTSYYDDLCVLRAGLFDLDRWMDRTAKSFSALQAIPGRHVQSIAEAGFDAWIRLYRPDEHTPNRTVSYYLKGGLVAFALDVVLRQRSNNTRSLDDVMRGLWSDFQRTGAGFDPLAIGAQIETWTGVNVDSELGAWVYGTEDPPLAALCAALGMSLTATPPTRYDVGWTLTAGDQPSVKSVRSGGPAEEAAIAPGDVLVAIDGKRATAARLAQAVLLPPVLEGAPLPAARPVSVHVFRRDRLLALTLQPALPTPTQWALSVDPDATPAAVQAREAWLQG